MKDIKNLRKKVKEIEPVVENILAYFSHRSIKLLRELDHIHVCVSKETGKLVFLIHLYDNFLGKDYKIHHKDKDKRNVIIWPKGDGFSLKILKVFDFDLQNYKDRISINAKEMGLREFLYVDVVKKGQKIRTNQNKFRIKRKSYDLIFYKPKKEA